MGVISRNQALLSSPRSILAFYVFRMKYKNLGKLVFQGFKRLVWNYPEKISFPKIFHTNHRNRDDM